MSIIQAILMHLGGKTRAVEELDANSILELIQQFNGIFWFNNHWLPEDMLTNSVGNTGNLLWRAKFVGLYTGTTLPAYARVSKEIESQAGEPYTWGKRRLFRARVYIGTYSEQYFYIVSGPIQDIQTGVNNYRHIGFKMIDAALYGTVGNGTSESTLLLTTISSSEHVTLDCDFKPGVECRFHLDGVDKGAITTNLPSGTIGADEILHASVANTEAADKNFLLGVIRCLQLE